MAIQTAVIVPGEVTQTAWDAALKTTTEPLANFGGVGACNSDDLPQGAANKYDTGVPPATQDDLPDGVTAKQFLATEKTKLAGVEDGATADQTGGEMRDAIVALAETERKILITNPQTGEFKILTIQRNATGNLEYDWDDVPQL